MRPITVEAHKKERNRPSLNVLIKSHHQSTSNIDLIYFQDSKSTRVLGFNQPQTDFNCIV